jgi:hypothetical protein
MNSTTVKNRWFSEIGLRDAYHQIRIQGYGCDPDFNIDFNIDVEGDVTRRAPAALDRDLSKEWAEPPQPPKISRGHLVTLNGR